MFHLMGVRSRHNFSVLVVQDLEAYGTAIKLPRWQNSSLSVRKNFRLIAVNALEHFWYKITVSFSPLSTS